jgi:hypothetical protein
MKSKCGHFAAKSYVDSHAGLCRKCHYNFVFLAKLEDTYGEDALVEYWYAMILSSPSSDKEISYLIDHLTRFYERKLNELPSKQKYIKKMLYMLHSLEKPFDAEDLR